MAEFPALRPQTRRRETVISFKGLDRRARPSAGSCCEMENLSPRALPCLAVRRGRERVLGCTAPTDLFALGGGLAVIDGTRLLYNGVERGTVSAGRHQLAAMGSRLAIFPDKKLFDAETLTLTDMEAHWSGSVRFTGDSIQAAGAAGFRVGDGVTISGCTGALAENNKTAVLREINGSTLVFSENCFESGSQSGVTLRREVPALEFVCEKDNRLWGVHGRSICCSVLGDPCNWNVFEGLATDGFSVETATDGPFTGCGVFSSHLLFFKEGCVHKVYGVKPSQFQVQVSRIPGVQAGCERSVCNVHETLYWWSREGLMAYGGGIPDVLSLPLGEDDYDGAAAGADGGTLRLSLRRGGVYERLCCDLESGVWCREDGERALAFAGDCWLGEDGVYREGGEERVAWSAVFGGFGETELADRIPVRLDVVGDFSEGAAVRVEAACGGGFRPVFSARCGGQRRLRIPVPLRRGRTVAVRLSGEGDVILRALVLTYLEGSE